MANQTIATCLILCMAGRTSFTLNWIEITLKRLGITVLKRNRVFRLFIQRMAVQAAFFIQQTEMRGVRVLGKRVAVRFWCVALPVKFELPC